MLTIQPNLLNSHKQLSFTKNVPLYPDGVPQLGEVYFDCDQIQAESRRDAAGWEQSKGDLKVIADKTKDIPVLQKGTNFLSGLVSVAISWCGLRWGAAGTLKVLSKFASTKPVKSVAGFAKKGVKAAGKLFGKAKSFFKGTKLYSKAGNKFAQVKGKALETGFGKKLSSTWNTIKNKNAYNKLIGWKKDFVAWVKNLNPKQIFVETMGIFGGGAAAVKELAGKAVVDGRTHEVSADGAVDGVLVEGYRNAA